MKSIKLVGEFFLFYLLFSVVCNSALAIEVDSTYPSLGELNQRLNVSVFGNGFNADTRLSLYPDSGNKGKVVSSTAGGGGWDIAVEKGVASIIDFSGNFKLFDINDPIHPILLGTTLLTPSYGFDVEISEGLAYVAHFNNISIIDTNPDNTDTFMTVLGTIELPTDGMVQDIFVKGSTIYAANGILHIIDAQDTSSLQVIGSFPAITATFLTGKDNLLYINNGNLNVVDVSNPVEPSILGTTTDTIYGNVDLTEIDGTLYAFAMGAVVKVNDPENPVVVGAVTFPDATEHSIVSGSMGYVSDQNSGLWIVDLNIPDSPTIIGSANTPSPALSSAIIGDLAYVVCGSSLEIIDISSPSLPTLTSWLDLPNYHSANSIEVVGDTTYIGGESLYVIDTSDMSSPQITGSVELNELDNAEMVVSGAYAYLVGYSSGLQIVGVDSGNSDEYLSIVGSYDDTESNEGYKSINIENGNAYIRADDNSLLIFDVTDPTAPTLSCALPSTAAIGFSLNGSTAYTGDSTRLSVLDMTSPCSPSEIGRADISPLDIDISGDYLYVLTDNGLETEYDKLKLKIFDIASPSSPNAVGEIVFDCLANMFKYQGGNLVISGTQAFVTAGEYGVHVIDISDPSAPVLIGTFNSLGLARDIEVVGNNLLVADLMAGLAISPVPIEISTATLISSTEISATIPSPPITGHFTIRAFSTSESSELDGGVSFTDTIDLLTSKAIIVAGGGDFTGNQIWEQTKAYANYAYDNLIYQGYKHEDITYITDEAGALDRYGDLAATANLLPALKNNLQNAIVSWANSSENSDLMLFLEDHGDTSEFMLRGGDTPEIVTAAELDSWLDTLQDTIPGKVIVVYDACRSGSFIQTLTPPLGKTRITMTSSAPGQSAYFLNNNHSFSAHFWSTFSGKTGEKAILSLAYDNASQSMAQYQTAQIDADGNGIPNQPSDLSALAEYEGTIYAMRRQYNLKSKSKPVIGSIAAPQILDGDTAPPSLLKTFMIVMETT